MSQNNPSVAFRAVISGRVQLVMFRDFIQRKASGMKLVGYVKNLPNGTVEIVAEGAQDAVDKIIEFAKKGPVLARVDDVHVEWAKPTGAYNGFVIEYS